MEYSIQNYTSPKEINDKIDALLKHPVKFLPEKFLAKTLNHFDTKCKLSKSLYAQAKNFIPGGVQHNLAFNFPFPICMEKAEGAYLFDVDGNKYTDLLQSGGPILVGNNNQNVKQKVLELLDFCGPVTGLFHKAELELAQEINKHMPHIEMFRMFNSGSEAVQASIRLARLHTGKKHVIKNGGAYHGWSNELVYGMRIPYSGKFEAHGIPDSHVKFTDEVFPNDIEAMRKQLRKNRMSGGTACIIVEPLGPESGTRPVDFEYNAQLKKLCEEFGTLLIFDEVVTGFRLGLKGAAGFFGVKPDLTVFGKIIGGGYPSCGGLGGSKEMMGLIAAGIETGSKKAFVAGTLAGNPLTAVAGLAAIREIEATNACVKAGLAGDRLTKGLQQLVEKNNLPFAVYNQGSIVHIECSGAMMVNLKGLGIVTAFPQLKKRKESMQQIGAAYMANGIVTLAGSRAYTSLADTDNVIDEALNKFENVFKQMSEN